MSALPRFCLGDALALAQKALRTSVEVLFERRPSGALDIERLLLIRYLPSGLSWITSLVHARFSPLMRYVIRYIPGKIAADCDDCCATRGEYHVEVVHSQSWR